MRLAFYLTFGLGAALLATVAGAQAPFSVAIDRVAISDGSAAGSLTDFIDEFADSAFVPEWSLSAGSAAQGGGVVTFTNPGKEQTMPNGTIEASLIALGDPTVGHARATSITATGADTPDPQEGAIIQLTSLDGDESVACAVVNTGAGTVLQGSRVDTSDHSNDTVQTVAIPAEALGAGYVLELLTQPSSGPNGAITCSYRRGDATVTLNSAILMMEAGEKRVLVGGFGVVPVTTTTIATTTTTTTQGGSTSTAVTTTSTSITNTTTTQSTGSTTTTTLAGPASGSISADTNPIAACQPEGGTTLLRWSSQGTSAVEIRIGSADGPGFQRSGAGDRTGTLYGVQNTVTFFLYDLDHRTVLDSVTIETNQNGCDQPRGALDVTPGALQACGSDNLHLRWTAHNVLGVHLTGIVNGVSQDLGTGEATGEKNVALGFVPSRIVLSGVLGSATEVFLDAVDVPFQDGTCGGAPTGDISATPEQVPVCLPSGGTSKLEWETAGAVDVQVRLNSPTGPVVDRSNGGSHSGTLYGFDTATTFYLAAASTDGAFVTLDSVHLEPIACDGSVDTTLAAVATERPACSGTGRDRLACALYFQAPGSACGNLSAARGVQKQVAKARKLLLTAESAKPGRAARLQKKVLARLSRAAAIARRAAHKNGAATTCAAQAQRMVFEAIGPK